MKNINQLIEESENFLTLAEKIQDENEPLEERETLLKKLSGSYHSWYQTSLRLFDTYNQQGERQKFEQEYEGSIWSARILKLLTSGLDISPFYDPDKPNPLVNKYAYSTSRCFEEPLLKQRNILAVLIKRASNFSKEAVLP